jgi:hypothetical protein
MVKKESVSKPKRMTKAQKEDLLIENFVGLQKAMTHLSLKFENLSDNLSKLLEVLELSARNYLTKEAPKDSSSSELAKQVNYLIDQNKAIAEGLLLIDDTIRKKQQSNEEKESSKENSSMQNKLRSRPLPKII